MCRKFAWIPFALVAAGCSAGAQGAPRVMPSSTIGPNKLVDGTTYAFTRVATASGLLGYLSGFTCLTPQTAARETTSATITAKVSAGQTFGGDSGLYAVSSTTDLLGCSDGFEATNETDYFKTVAVTRSSPEIVILVGSIVSYSNGIVPALDETTRITYGTSGQIVYESPTLAGRTWTSLPTATIVDTSSDSESISARTVSDDGSYTEVSNHSGSGFLLPYDQVTTIENGDASGIQTEVAGPNASASPATISLSAPSRDSVTEIVTGSVPPPPDAPTPSPNPCAASTPSSTATSSPCPASTSTVKVQYAWYPYTPTAEHPFETISSIDKGITKLPTTCATAATFPKSADLTETTDAALDIWVGTSLLITDLYTDPSFGPLCSIVSSNENYYAFGPTSSDTTPDATETLEYVDSRVDNPMASTSITQVERDSTGDAGSVESRLIASSLSHISRGAAMLGHLGSKPRRMSHKL